MESAAIITLNLEKSIIIFLTHMTSPTYLSPPVNLSHLLRPISFDHTAILSYPPYVEDLFIRMFS